MCPSQVWKKAGRGGFTNEMFVFFPFLVLLQGDWGTPYMPIPPPFQTIFEQPTCIAASKRNLFAGWRSSRVSFFTSSVGHHRDTPIAGWLIMENPTKMHQGTPILGDLNFYSHSLPSLVRVNSRTNSHQLRAPDSVRKKKTSITGWWLSHPSEKD